MDKLDVSSKESVKLFIEYAKQIALARKDYWQKILDKINASEGKFKVGDTLTIPSGAVTVSGFYEEEGAKKVRLTYSKKYGGNSFSTPVENIHDWRTQPALNKLELIENELNSLKEGLF